MSNEFSAEENIVSFILSNSYGLNIKEVHRINAGYGSGCFSVSTHDKKYIFKMLERNPMNHPEQIPLVHDVLKQAGIPVSSYFRNREGQFATSYEDKDCMLQSFIEGSGLMQNTAPDWFMEKSASMLGKIHRALESIPLLCEGMGQGFLDCMKTDHIRNFYHASLNTALTNGESKIASDIEFRLSILEDVKQLRFSLSEFTLKNTHGDYKIDQIICGDRRINGVIDIDACVHPVCWEIIRSFTYADPECVAGKINVEKFKRYIEDYLKVSGLKPYDLKMMPYFYYFQLAVCNYFGQYYGMTHPNRGLLLDNAHWSTSLLRWLKENVQPLSDQLLGSF